MEWVEVEAKTVDAAVSAAIEELGLASRDEVSVEVIQEPEKGFLGFGGTEAIVRVKPAPKQKSGSGRGRRGRGGGDGGGKQGGRPGQQGGQKQRNSGRGRGQGSGGSQGGGGGRGGDSGGKSRQDSQGGRGGGRKPENKGKRGNGGSAGRDGQRDGRSPKGDRQRSEPSVESTQEADVAEQSEILKSFMVGLIDAFGLEGDVATRIDDDIIYIDVTGEQTEALVGSRGVILQSILDLMKIIVQRKTHHRARIRLDIAGYSERRREALGIYSRRLSEQVLADGQEVMLEAMHPGDRKVVHDAVAEIEGVRSWSEGEEPQRSVIIGLAPGFEAAGGDDDEE